MSETTDDFAFPRALSKMIKNFLRAHVLIDGVVTAVNENFTVDLTIQSITYSNVPTKILIGSQASIYEIPVIGSACLVKWRDGNRGLPQVDSFDQVDQWLLNPNKTIFNGGENGGMVLVNPLVTKVNNIENLLNDLITKYNSHIHPLSTGTSSPTLTQETGTIAPITQASDIESTVITQ